MHINKPAMRLYRAMKEYGNRTIREERRSGIVVCACILGVFLVLVLCGLAFGAENGTASSQVKRGEAIVKGIDPGKAVLACIGEAEGEPYIGKVAVMETIRRRGSLKGVYGINAPRVKKKLYSAAVYDECLRAWNESANTNYSKGAMGWGNAADFKVFESQAWFKGKRVVVIIGNHRFWK